MGLLASHFAIQAQVEVISSQNTNRGYYTTLQAAFAAVNDGTYTDAVQVEITGSTVETATAVLNASGVGAVNYVAVSILPTGTNGVTRVISGDIAGNPLVDLNGADNVTITGNACCGADRLTFSNISTANTAGTSTIRFRGDAVGNTINSCILLGSSTTASSTEGGTVLFSGGAISTGNDNNSFYACNIGPAGTNLPSKAIHSVGTATSVATYNSGIHFESCNIYDFFHPSTASNGILVGNGNIDWIIEYNRFYQTATRTHTTGVLHAAVELASTNINNCIINSNTVGYASENETGTYTFVGVANSRMQGIRVSAHGIITPSSIQGNTITAINISGACSGTSGNAAFGGIMITTGSTDPRVNIGNLVGNVIGSTSAAGAISYSSTNSAANDIIGIYYLPTAHALINNNAIGGITAANTGGGSIFFAGIRSFTGNTKIDTIQNNTIGYAAAPISLLSANASSSTRCVGIQSQDGNVTLTGNTIAYMTMDGPNTSTSATTPAMAGILLNATNTTLLGHNISQNTIHSLSNTASSAAVLVNGIVYNGATSGNASIISRNKIHSLSVSNASANLNGIRIAQGRGNFSNNMISLGYDAVGASITVGAAIIGINEFANSTSNFYFNSVNIGGTGVVGAANTFALNSAVVNNTRNYQNNIFYNTRSNASGTSVNYGIQVGGTAANPAGLTSNYNLIYTNGTGGMFGRFNSADVANLAGWQTATGQDANSVSSAVDFISNSDLHICGNNPGVGTAAGGITIDIDGDTRTAPTIGADEYVAPVVPSVAIVSDDVDNSVLSGTSVTFTATPTNGGASPIYQWKKNSTDVGANQDTYTDAGLVDGDTILCVITSSLCASPQSTSSTAIVMTVITCSNPTAYTVTGGGAYCAGGAGVVVGLDNSESGVNYQLQLGGVNDGAVVAGTGAAISFGTKTAAGTYTVVATTAVGGCTTNMTGSVAISITPIPAAPSITASNYSPCGGTQFTLTAVPPTGYTGAQYLWLKNGTPLNSGVSPTYNVNAGTVAASNDYTLQMVYTGGTCLSAASTAATIVTSVPDAVITPAGATTFCAGTINPLNANTGTGFTYQWKRGATIVQVGGTSYIPTVSGSHTVTITNASGCKKTSVATLITVNALPTANAGADQNLCKGASVQIGAATTAGYTYTWSPTTGLSNPYISNPTLTTNVAGTYTVSVIDGLKGCSKSDAMVVTSISGPATPSVSKTVSGTTITLTSVTPGAASVNWYSNGALLFSNMAANSSINVVAANPAKAYTVKSKGTNGCLSNFSNFVSAKVGDDKTGDVLVAIDENVMQAYPNPTNGLLNVTINDAALTSGTLLLYNNLGQVVATKEISFFAGKANTTLDLQHLSAGVYSLSFENKIVKVVKE